MNKAVPDNTVLSSSPLPTPSKPSTSSKSSKKSKRASLQAGTTLSLLCAESGCSEQLLLLLCGGISAPVLPPAAASSPSKLQVAVQQESASQGSVWDRLEGGRDKWLQLADHSY
jgi:hypothetical protein